MKFAIWITTLSLTTMSVTAWAKSKSAIIQAKQFDEGARVEVIRPPLSLWNLNYKIEEKVLVPSPDVLASRLNATLTHPLIADPVTLNMVGQNMKSLIYYFGNKDIQRKVKNFRRGSEVSQEFYDRVWSRVQKNQLRLEAYDLSWLDLDKLGKNIARPMSMPTFSLAEWKAAFEDPKKKAGLEDFFQSKTEFIQSKVNRWESQNPTETEVPLTAILPDHLQEQFGAYSPFKGRNCFATALSFADANVVTRAEINLVREVGHGVGMINGDEFSNALRLGYYPLADEDLLYGLKYGDVIVIIDKARGNGYSQYRHAAVHIGGDYYLQKQSKSASTPIEIVEWNAMVNVWAKVSEKMDYVVFRKLPITPEFYQNALSFSEKISWVK